MVDERKRLLPPRIGSSEEDPPCGCSECCIPFRIENRTCSKTAVLITVALERLAFYSISGNLILFLNGTKYNWSSYAAMNASYIFLGVACIFYFIGGIAADIKFGRFKVIVFAFAVYTIGYAFFPVMSNKQIINKLSTNATEFQCNIDAMDKEKYYCPAVLYLALVIVAMGTGMLRANIAPFGADQLHGEEPRKTVGFFNWYYWSINVGTLVALGGIAYLQQGISDNGFFYGYISGICSLILGLIAFMMGMRTYRYKKPVGSVFKTIFKIIREASRIKKRKLNAQQHRLNISRAPTEIEEEQGPTAFLDYAKFRHGGSYHDHDVDDIKKLGKILAVFTALIPYWIVYYQMETTFLVQGLHMRLFLGKEANVTKMCNVSPSTVYPPDKPLENGFGIAVAWLTLFDVVLLIILIPVMDKIIYPWINSQGWSFTMVKRILVGFVFALLAIIAAGLLEIYRRGEFWRTDAPHCCYKMVPQQIQKGVTYYAADLSIFWQIPQYALIGFSEIFTSIAGLEFASMVAPRSMKSSVMGLFYFFSGLGSFLGSLILFMLQNRWFFDEDHGNINCQKGCYNSKGTCHLDWYFFLLGGIQAAGFLFFLILIRKLKLEEDPAIIGHASLNDSLEERERPRSRNRGRRIRVQENPSNITTPERSTTPRSLIDTDIKTESSASESGFSGGEADGIKRLSNMAKRGVVNRTISKDRTGRIGLNEGAPES
ncbi:solute carrier family 15 member 4-like [Mya arenaria]|uniref:solute carrier family 15 member 4-like n=1 Tax=Mya arenaria TaxID=6604 RepID=UPI0022E72661|nr:solute carrier family 15 member 4-like [Mya arenaria]